MTQFNEKISLVFKFNTRERINSTNLEGKRHRDFYDVIHIIRCCSMRQIPTLSLKIFNWSSSERGEFRTKEEKQHKKEKTLSMPCHVKNILAIIKTCQNWYSEIVTLPNRASTRSNHATFVAMKMVQFFEQQIHLLRRNSAWSSVFMIIWHEKCLKTKNRYGTWICKTKSMVSIQIETKINKVKKKYNYSPPFQSVRWPIYGDQTIWQASALFEFQAH